MTKEQRLEELEEKVEELKLIVEGLRFMHERFDLAQKYCKEHGIGTLGESVLEILVLDNRQLRSEIAEWKKREKILMRLAK